MNEQDQFLQRPNRRGVLRTATGGLLGAGLGIGNRRAAAAASAVENKKTNPHAASRPIWRLERPQPALPNSYFWTWDHSTNWMWDDPGMLNFGANNRYLKQPVTYVADYRRLTDLAAGLGVKGVLIWGFLRDAHGGVDAAKRVADYASSQSVAIMPGIGTNHYGGVYYEGHHPYNMGTFLERHPDARSIGADGKPRRGHSACPSHPRFVEWLQEGIRWLFDEFDLGGANLENGDFLTCHCAKCQARRGQWPPDEPDFWRHQHLGYAPALEALRGQLKDKLITWATYKGFLPGSASKASYQQRHAYMECRRPVLIDKLPPEAICQWTLTRMVRQHPLPLTTYLDQGAPEEASTNDIWAAAVKPPTTRSAGFLHQGSQWCGSTRYDQIVSTIKEGCLRAYRAGLEGVSVHGEVSTMHVPWALNYLAFSHFIHWPEDSLRQFGTKTLGQVLDSADEGEAFAELFAHWDAGLLSEAQRDDIRKRSQTLQGSVSGGADLGRWRFWNWLAHVADATHDRHTRSVF